MYSGDGVSQTVQTEGQAPPVILRLHLASRDTADHLVKILTQAGDRFETGRSPPENRFEFAIALHDFLHGGVRSLVRRFAVNSTIRFGRPQLSGLKYSWAPLPRLD